MAVVTCPVCAPEPCDGLVVLVGNTSDMQPINQHRPSGVITVPDEATKTWWLRSHPDARVVVVGRVPLFPVGDF